MVSQTVQNSVGVHSGPCSSLRRLRTRILGQLVNALSLLSESSTFTTRDAIALIEIKLLIPQNTLKTNLDCIYFVLYIMFI